jgi:polyisoprenoid-binding protein YceI
MFGQRHLTIFITIAAFLTLLLAACGGNGSPNKDEPNEPAAAEVEAEAPAEPAEAAEQAEPSAASMQTFVIIPAESRASYIVDEEFLQDALSKLGIEAGQKDVIGSTQVVEGQIQLNPDDLSAVLGENNFTVDLSTLESDQDRRDKWIRENGPTFDRFPVAAFTATSLSGLPDSYNEGEELRFQVNGDLTVREVTVPVTFDAAATLNGDTLSGVLVTRGLISDFGIEPPAFANTLTVADDLGIQVEFTAKRE